MLNDRPVVAVIPVEDTTRAKKFYTEKLGLEYPEGKPVPEVGVFLESGDGTMMYLYKPMQESVTKPEHTVATWLAKDIGQTVGELRKKGISFEKYDMPDLKTDDRGVAEVGGAKVAWFKDSEGNTLAVTEIPKS